MRNRDDEFAAKRFAYEKREKGSDLDSLLANADEIVPNLYLGSENAAIDAEVLKEHGKHWLRSGLILSNLTFSYHDKESPTY